MQYKIPVQIENDDPILLGLSLKDLTIVMIGAGLGYIIFNSFAPRTGPEIAFIPAIIPPLIALVVVKFNIAGMRFVTFILAAIRYRITGSERIWYNGVDSFQPIDIGFLSNIEEKQQEKVDFTNKIDKIKTLEDQLKKI
jgi:PrgI family protein